MTVTLIIISFLLIYFKMSRLETKLDTLIDEQRQPQSIIENMQQEEIELEYIQQKNIEAEEIEITPNQSTPPQPSSIDNFKAKFAGLSIEEILFGNIILKIGVVAFILGVGLFLKYSIDKEWIPIWGRAIIGLFIGIVMIVGGIKLITNPNKLFGEGLFGGGIAILYLSVFAGFAIDNFKFLSYEYALVLMIAITILAGILSLRYDAKSTAIFGLIGGFLTPFLINKGINNVEGLLTYMLILNLGILYLSIYKKWSILVWLAYIVTIITQFWGIFEYHLDMITIYILYTLFFLIYSIVPFINDIREQKEEISRSLLVLFSINTILFLGVFYILLISHNIDSQLFVFVTIPVALYLLIYASGLAYSQILLKNLFYIILAQAIAILIITPSFVFGGASLTIVWAVEALMLIWIAQKSREKLYAKFGLLGLALALVRYIFIDILDNINLPRYNLSIEDTAMVLGFIYDFAIISIFVLSSIVGIFIWLKKSRLDIAYLLVINNLLISLAIGLFFIFLNIELYNLMNIYYPNATKFSITILWILFGITIFIIGVFKDIKATKIVGTGVIFLAIIKAFFSDLSKLDAIYKIVLFMILGMLLFGVSYFYQSKANTSKSDGDTAT